jgi:hypothetical protein
MTLPELDEVDRAYAKLFGFAAAFLLAALVASVVGVSFAPAPHAKHHSPAVIHPRTTWNV